MKIDSDIKLDFSDVLLIPKSSELNSRSEVDVEREFVFKYSKFRWKGVPIIVSNMDTTGTVEMARELQKFKIITCLHKYYRAEDIPEDLDRNFYAVSTGIQDSDLDNLDLIIQKHNPHFICIDVANGYAKRFLEVVKKLREKYPTKTLIGGNELGITYSFKVKAEAIYNYDYSKDNTYCIFSFGYYHLWNQTNTNYTAMTVNVLKIIEGELYDIQFIIGDGTIEGDKNIIANVDLSEEVHICWTILENKWNIYISNNSLSLNIVQQFTVKKTIKNVFYIKKYIVFLNLYLLINKKL